MNTSTKQQNMDGKRTTAANSEKKKGIIVKNLILYSLSQQPLRKQANQTV